MSAFKMPEPCGEAEPFSGRSADHSQAIFHRDSVRPGTKLYTAEALRDVLEQAAKVCDSVNNHSNPMTANDCADSIRSLKEQIK